MIGGSVIEVRPMRILAGEHPGKQTDVLRLWCIDKRNADECAVYCEPGEVQPQLGDEVWWQSGKVYLTSHSRGLCDFPLRKVGYSFRPQGSESHG